MSGYSVQIKPGPAQQVSGSSPSQNATIYNQDTEHSVWISNTQAVTPNNGMLLGPQGTLQWTSKGQPWACVDTGVIDNVQLTVSDDVNNIQNPVAIAEAIAIAGIPSVLLQDQIYNAVVPGNGSFSLNVSKYATITILSDTTSIGGIGPSFTYQWLDANNNLLFSDIMNSLKNTPPSYASIQLSVIAPKLKIINNNGIAQSFIVYGTNRAIDGIEVQTFNRVAAFSTGSVAWVPGQTNSLNSVGAGSFPNEDQSRYVGLCSITVTLTGTSAATVASSELFILDADSDNAIVIMDGSEFHAIGGHSRCYKQFVHPRTPMNWLWTSQATATYAIAVAISGN